MILELVVLHELLLLFRQCLLNDRPRHYVVCDLLYAFSEIQSRFLSLDVLLDLVVRHILGLLVIDAFRSGRCCRDLLSACVIVGEEMLTFECSSSILSWRAYPPPADIGNVAGLQLLYLVALASQGVLQKLDVLAKRLL